MADLLPCPFCGGDAETDGSRAFLALPSGQLGYAVAVYCTECPADISLCLLDVPEATVEMVVELWNKRTPIGA